MSRFEVTAPDGRKFEVNGPDGSTQEDAIRYVQQTQMKQAQGLPATMANAPKDLGTETYFDIPSLSFKQRPKSGDVFDAMGQGAERFIRGAGNLGISALNKVASFDPTLEGIPDADRAIKGGWFSDEDVRAQDADDAAIEDLHPFAYTAGEMLPTLPLSAGLGLASGSLRSLPLVGRLLGSGTLRGGVEGAINAAATSSPDQQGSAAELGGGFGALVGPLGGRFVRGLLPHSDTLAMVSKVLQYVGPRGSGLLARALTGDTAAQRAMHALFSDPELQTLLRGSLTTSAGERFRDQ